MQKANCLLALLILPWVIFISCIDPITSSANKTIERELAEVGIYFSKQADTDHLITTASVIVSAADMDTIAAELMVTANEITGKIQNIPAGEDRKFEVSVFDDNEILTYSGQAITDIAAGSIALLNITLYPVNGTGTVIISGIFSDFPAPESKIVFQADYNGQDDIYIMNPDGSDLINLTNSPSFLEIHPRISPDMRQIVFVRYTTNGLRRPFIMNLDGSNPRELDIHEGANVGHLAWSPEGDKLVFYSNNDGGDQDVYIFDIRSGSITQLTFNNTTDWVPVWSSDGDWIAYFSDETGTFKSYLMHPDGSEKRPTVPMPGFEQRGQEFSPLNSQRIAMVARDHATWDLFLINRGESVIQLTTTQDRNEYHHSWSPDGKSILYVQRFENNDGLYLMDIETKETRVLLDDPNFDEEHPHWR